MEKLLAFCESPTCGTVFEVSRFIKTSGPQNVNITNSKYGPCPRCGSMGIIPDGTYRFVGSTISLLTGPSSSVRLLRKVETILKAARKAKHSKNRILKDVEQTSPQIASALRTVPAIDNLPAWLSVIITLVMLALQIHLGYLKQDESKDRFIEYLLEENRALKSKSIAPLDEPTHQPFVRTKKKVGRNDKCPCGSGKKYKKCCLISNAIKA